LLNKLFIFCVDFLMKKVLDIPIKRDEQIFICLKTVDTSQLNFFLTFFKSVPPKKIK